MAATRAQTESTSSLSPSVRDMSADAEAKEDQTPARRTTTRTRKLPSRLLPSPSPPPSRPSSQFLANKHLRAGKDVGPQSPATPTPVASHQHSKPRRSVKLDSPPALADRSSPEAEMNDKDATEVDVEETGPGKRKRRPSSMYRPPSTLTVAESNPTTPLASSKAKKKVRGISPDSAVPSKAPNGTVTMTYGKNRSRSARAKLEHSPAQGSDQSHGKSTTISTAEGYDSDNGIDPVAKGHRGEMTGPESEAETDGLAGARERLSKKARTILADDASDLSPPPLLPRDGSARIRMPTRLTQPTFIKGGQVSISPEGSVKRVKSGLLKGIKAEPLDLGSRTLDSRVQLGATRARQESQRLWRPTDGMSSSPISPAMSRFDPSGLSRLSLGPSPAHSRHLRAGHNTTTTGLFHVNVSDEDADEEEDEEDENDFHQAMLDADLDFFDSQKSEHHDSNTWSPTGLSSHDDIELDDTPATTPRSPQSGCGLPTPGSPSSRSEDAVTDTAADKTAYPAHTDNVFVHALPTPQVGADKPHQHAGNLTLSLPYSPDAAAASPQLRAMDVEAMSTSRRPAGSLSKAPMQLSQDSAARLTTPIIQRRKHMAVTSTPLGLGMLKFGPELVERMGMSGASFMQLSPMLEMDSPMLSPGLSLNLGTKAPEPLSPFVIGVSALPELDQPASLVLPPSRNAESQTSDVSNVASEAPKVERPKAEHPKCATPVASGPEKPKGEVKSEMKPTPQAAPTAFAATTAPPMEKRTEQPKHEMVALKRPALPPPRQIRFTTFTSVETTGPSAQKHSSSAPSTAFAHAPAKPDSDRQPESKSAHTSGARSESGNTPQAKATCDAASPSERTPDLVYSGSSSPGSSSDSSSTISSVDSESMADAEVETILFGPPEKLDLRELDQAWGASKAANNSSSSTDSVLLRRANLARMSEVSPQQN